MAKYTIVTFIGVPDEIKVNSDRELLKELKNLEKKFDPDEYADFEVNIYDSKNKDVTDKMFKKFKLGQYA